MGHKGIAYADEILYAAAISPLSIAKNIPKKANCRSFEGYQPSGPRGLTAYIK